MLGFGVSGICSRDKVRLVGWAETQSPTKNNKYQYHGDVVKIAAQFIVGARLPRPYGLINQAATHYCIHSKVPR